MPVTKLQRAEVVFSAAVELGPEEQGSFVKAECGDDSDLMALVHKLLEAHEKAGRFLDEPTFVVAAAPHEGEHPQQSALETEELSATIGPYKLLQKIGEGGFGSVYMAEQQTPVVRRVALKIIKMGMDTRQVIARFEAERQALAMMDHPNIAKVFDAGATDSGRPYFVMELVRGDPVTKYCDAHNLSTRGRLELFQQICHAVQHAHQKGIIHRDIKPNNVLVTVADGRAIPKMIDFGIAKATSLRLTDKTLFTEHRQLIGTPQYMSPEQADSSGTDLDTRSDIYSLGVLLYELLTGTTPFDPEALRSAALGEVQRIIREVEPPRPSTRIHTLGGSLGKMAAHRDTEPSKLSGLMRGDLDWVVMKAMEKDRSRRYESASALAADITRHLAGEPVAAAPPSTAYRVRKFVRRHRVGVMAGAAIGGALLLGVIGTTLGMIWAIRAEREQNRMRGAAVEGQRETKQNAEFTGNLARASGAIAAHDGAWAIERLDSIPESLRGWEWRYLRRQADVSLDTFEGHTAWIRCLALSPDGTMLASGSDDQTVRIWNAATGTLVREIKGHKAAVYGVAWNPAGTRIATCTVGGGVGLWDVATGERVGTDSPAHSDIVRTVAFSPDGSYFVTGSFDSFIKKWDAKTGEKIGEVKTKSVVLCLRFSRDGTLASAGEGTVLLWRPPFGAVDSKPLLEDKALVIRGRVNTVAFSPDGARLAFSSFGGEINVCSVSTGKVLSVLQTHANIIPGLEFSPDGRRLASSGSDGVVRLWDPDVSEPLATLIGHAGMVGAVTFSRDGTRLYSSSADSTLKVWDAVSDQSFGAGSTPARICSVAFSADGAHIAAVFQDGRIRMWDSLVGGVGDEGALTGGEVVLTGDMSIGTPLVFSPDRRCFATTGRNSTIELFDADTGERVRVLRGHTDVVKFMAFNHDGTRLASGGIDRRIKVWDVATGAQVAGIETNEPASHDIAYNSECFGLAFSPDDSMLAWGGAERVGLCDGATLQTLHTLHVGGEAGSPSGAFGTDGSRANYVGEDAKGLSVAFSHDGSQLFVCANSGRVTVWSPQTGKQLGEVAGQTHSTTRAAFSPDRTRIILSSSAGFIRVCDTAQELVGLKFADSTYMAAFSPDGTQLAYGFWDGDGGVRVLDTVPESGRYRERQAIRAAEPEARDILSAALANETDYALVARRLREDPKLSAPVRRVALHLLLARGLAEQEEVRKLVDSLRKANPGALQFVEAVRTEPAIPERLRAKVIRYAGQELRPLEWNKIAWERVKSPGGSMDDYRRGLIEAQEAARLLPARAAVINTLGVAQFRVGDFEAALATLTHADEMNSKPENPSNANAPPGRLGNPGDVAFIAMTLHELGRKVEAGAAMGRLRELMKLERWQKDSAYKDASLEAEEMVR